LTREARLIGAQSSSPKCALNRISWCREKLAAESARVIGHACFDRADDLRG